MSRLRLDDLAVDGFATLATPTGTTTTPAPTPSLSDCSCVGSCIADQCGYPTTGMSVTIATPE